MKPKTFYKNKKLSWETVGFLSTSSREALSSIDSLRDSEESLVSSRTRRLQMQPSKVMIHQRQRSND